MNRILMIILDGAGDRQQAELGGVTPLDAAHTPNLDALASAGSTGLMWPLGPGRAPTSPLAHFALFGYPVERFPGRGLFEALGEGVDLEPGAVVCRANFARCEVRDGALWVTDRPDPRAGGPVNADVDLDLTIDDIRCEFVHTGAAQGLLVLAAQDGSALSDAVTDADPLRPDAFVRRVMPFAEAPDTATAERTANVLNEWMREARRRLRGRDLDSVLIKWAAARTNLPPFSEITGMRGATLATGALYRGLAAVVGLDALGASETDDPAADLSRDLSAALDLLDAGHEFVHVHTKWPDRAGHRKSPARKREVLEALDSAIGPHLERLVADDLVVCVTADHQTPSSGPLYHSGGAVPILVTGGAAGRDPVVRFGESSCAAGALGHMLGTDLMPLLLDCADRSAFAGAERYSTVDCAGTRRESSLEWLQP